MAGDGSAGGHLPAVRAVVESPVATVILDNPERRNAMTLDMYAAVPPTVAALRDDPSARVVVLRGAGDRAFGAGSDIAEFPALRRGDAATHYNATEAAAAEAIASLPVPVVALVHGPCIGGGLGLALCADLRYAADDARFAVTPARLGLAYPPDAMARLVAAVGPPRAAELVLTARELGAEDAARIGLVTEVVAKDRLEARVSEVCERIASLAPLSLAAAKAAIAAPDHPDTAAAVRRCFGSRDYDEGIAAYLEKRPPRFVGE